MFRGLRVLALVAGVAVGSCAVFAQATSGQQAGKMFTNKQQFRLPFSLEERERQKLREIQLYVKYGNENWTCRETASPMQKSFTFRAQQDGEYSFSIVTVDKSGRATPSDVTHEAPALVVVVDTQKPEVDVTPGAAGPGGEECLHLSARDANLDPSTVTLEYQSQDKSWHALEAIPNSPETYHFPDRASWNGQLRASAADRAGNTISREINGSAWNTPAASTPAAASVPAAAPSVVSVPAPMNPVPTTSTPVTPPSVNTVTSNLNSRPEKPLAEGGPALETPPNAHPTMAQGGTTPVPTPMNRDSNQANRQLVNSTHVVLDYRIDVVGPSGVSKLDVWMTPDEGKTWQRLCEDTNHRSPVEFDLPREGLFGIRLVATNGNNISDPPPAGGTQPDWWIEVDTTRPTAQLQSVRPGSGDDAGSLIITWAASDRNLGSEPVDLYYATHREGPWTPIARGIRNEGNFRWPAPRDGGPEYYIRLEVTDRAGNLTRCETPQAVVLDLLHPQTKVLGVSASAPRPLTPPTGN